MDFSDLFQDGYSLPHEMTSENVNDIVNHSYGGHEPLLFPACRQGRLDLIDHLLKLGADCNIIVNNRISPLNVACKYNNIDVVQRLLEGGANPNLHGSYQPTALESLRFAEDRSAILDRLVSYGANLNYDDGYMESTFLWCILRSYREEDYEFLEKVLSAGLNVKENKYPYIAAFSRKHKHYGEDVLNVVSLLMKFGASPDVPFYYKRTHLPFINIAFAVSQCDMLILHLIQNGLVVDDMIISEIIYNQCTQSLNFLLENKIINMNQSFTITQNGYDMYIDDSDEEYDYEIENPDRFKNITRDQTVVKDFIYWCKHTIFDNDSESDSD